MRRVVWAVSLLLCLGTTSCGALSEETRPTPPERSVVVPRSPGRPPIAVTEDEFRAAMRVLLSEIQLPARFGRRAPDFEVVLAALDPAQLALARDYRQWCERRRQSSDCLALLGSRAVLSQDDKYKVAFEIALGAEWDGFTEELRGMADSTTVRVVLLGAMVAYVGMLAFPELVTKGIAAAITVVLTAYLGAETVWNLVAGWLQLVEEVNAATAFWQLRAAGERYGKRIGAQTARVLVMVVTAGLAEGGQFLARVLRLPNAATASVALASDTGGKLVLAELGQVGGVAVAETGVTVVLTPTAELAQQATAMAMAARGTARAAKPEPICEDGAQWHHIATVENSKSAARGGPWTPPFERLFAKAELSMENAANKVRLKGHVGPHPREYHQIVYERLARSVSSCTTAPACRVFLEAELRRLSKAIATPGTRLNGLVTRGCK
ncbi:MAG TPA: AHH domain-containing protein [Myxococcaceae bacterium]|nr:AHH domain-containing protein [Myxococcaceae bacterium]